MSHLKLTFFEHRKGWTSLCVIISGEEGLWHDVVYSKGLEF